MQLKISDERFIIIAPRKYYQDIITYFQHGQLKNFKFYTKQEILENFYGKYDINAIIYTMNKFNKSYNNAKLLIDNIYFLPKNYYNEKATQLVELYEELNAQGYLQKNEYLEYELNSKPIYIVGYGNEDKELETVLDFWKIKANYIGFDRGEFLPSVFEFENIDDEVFNFFNTLCDLLKQGVNQKDIVLVVNNDSYAFAINKMCRQFNLSKLIKAKTNLLNMPKILNIIKQIESSGVEEFLIYNDFSINEEINLIKDLITTNKIREIKNNSRQIETLKTILKNETIYQEATPFIHNKENLGLIFPNKFYFILGFNQGRFPVIKKDDDYLTNKEKTKLRLSTSFIENSVSKNEIIDQITHAENIYISYALVNSGEKLYPSNLIKELGMKVEKIKTQKIYSGLKRKFDLDSPERQAYQKLFNISYLNYNRSFTPLNNYVCKDERNYSYSQIKTFFQCQFKYYLQNILNLNTFEETFAQKTGTLFHEILTHVYEDNFDFESLYSKIINKFVFEAKEKILLERKKEELKILCEMLIKQKSQMNLKDVYFEKEFTIKLKDKVFLNGKIDKIIVTTDGKNDYYSIIDYKSGAESYNRKEVPYGYSLQLPTYAFLLSESDTFKDKELIGFYIQHILSTEIGNVEENKMHYFENFKLVGETINEIDKIVTFDATYSKSFYIKSLALTKNNSFVHYAKVLSRDEFLNLIQVTKNNYLEADQKIQEGNFIINPKIINGEQNTPCKYCEFGDICNVKECDFVTIDLKGDFSNGVD